jgi:XTP/dITP diphosphohydrolase
VIQRVTRAGFPTDLIPAGITSITVTADADAEDSLRTAVLEFMYTIRGVEKAVGAGRRSADLPTELDIAPVGSITEDEWRDCWPVDSSDREPDSAAEESESVEAGLPAAGAVED